MKVLQTGHAAFVSSRVVNPSSYKEKSKETERERMRFHTKSSWNGSNNGETAGDGCESELSSVYKRKIIEPNRWHQIHGIDYI
jgi:hypothetical protein